MKKITIRRVIKNNIQILGELLAWDTVTLESFQCKVLELPWRNNQVKISCIPTGIYKVVRRYDPNVSRFKYPHLHILEVPGRSWILIHAGNFYTDIEGCILPGSKYIDLNADGNLDVYGSRDTLDKLLFFLGNFEVLDLEVL